MEKDNPLVSICMPAYNAGKYIAQAVGSVLEQTYQHIELIIVNDGSTDNTATIINQLKDSRVKVLHQENKGQSAAANAAFKASNGTLIKFMDADDLISPQFIENQVKCIDNQTDVIVSAAWGRFYNDDLSTFKLTQETIGANLPGHEWLVQSWYNANAMMQCALWLIPKVIIEKSGLWDESLGLINDLDFFTRILLNCKTVLFEEKAILYYRSGIPGSLSDQKSATAVLSAFKSVKQSTSNLLAVNQQPVARRACANIWQQFIYENYPNHPDYLSFAEKKIEELGGANLNFKCGGFTKLLCAIVGWKSTKKIKRLLIRPAKIGTSR